MNVTMDESETFLPTTANQKTFKNKQLKFINKIKRNKTILCCLDFIIASVLIGPLTTGFWRSTWELMDRYHEYFPGWNTYLFSMSVHVSFAFSREIFQEHFDENNWSKSYWSKIVSRSYTYFFGVISVMQWRSIWVLCDEYFVIEYNEFGYSRVPVYWKEYLFAGCAVIVLMCFMKIFKNILSTPLAVDLDLEQVAYNFQTRFKVKVTKLKFCLDFLKICNFATN